MKRISTWLVRSALLALSTLGTGCADTPDSETSNSVEALTSTTSRFRVLSIANTEIAACDDLKIVYHGFPSVAAADGNWISLNPVGSPDDVRTFRNRYLAPSSGSGDISLSTRGLDPSISHEVRFYVDWAGSQTPGANPYVVAARLPFDIKTSAACNAPRFTSVDAPSGNSIHFKVAHLKATVPTNPFGWVTLAELSQPAHKYVATMNLPATADADTSFNTSGIPAGTYELRLFEDWKGTKEYYVYDRKTVVLR